MREACLGVGRLLRAAAGEGRDERVLGWRERTAGKPGDVEIAGQRFATAETEDFELAALDLLGDGVGREERDAEPFARSAIDTPKRGMPIA